MENYSVVKQIGEGSYGKVSLVRDSAGKSCVMKVVDTRRMSAKEKKGAMNEVKVLSALKHPYVIRYYESFLTNSKLHIVMAFAEKGDLYSRIKQAKAGKPISHDQVLEWLTQGSLALKYLHDKHILHRDLKTQNMFLTKEDRLKIGDFGISRVLDGTCAFAKTVIGTPYYMSPEVCSERPYSWASDIWALGCVLYELFQLRVPFEATSIRALMQRIVRGAIPRATRAQPEAQQLCADMMARDPKARPTAAQILERPAIQTQIRAMLKQHEHDSTAGEDNKGKPPAGPTPAAAVPTPFVDAGQRVMDRPAQVASPRPPCHPSPAQRPHGLRGGLREPSQPQLLLDGRHQVQASPRYSPTPRNYRAPSPNYRAPSPHHIRGGSPTPHARAASPHYRAASPAAYRAASPQRYPSPHRGGFAPGVPDHNPDPRDWYARAIGVLR